MCSEPHQLQKYVYFHAIVPLFKTQYYKLSPKLLPFILVSSITVSINQEIQRVQRVSWQWEILRRISESSYLIKVWAGLGGREEWRATGVGWLAPQGPEGVRKEDIIGT